MKKINALASLLLCLVFLGAGQTQADNMVAVNDESLLLVGAEREVVFEVMGMPMEEVVTSFWPSIPESYAIWKRNDDLITLYFSNNRVIRKSINDEQAS